MKTMRIGDAWYFIEKGYRGGPFSTKDQAQLEGERYIVDKRKEEEAARRAKREAAKYQEE